MERFTLENNNIEEAAQKTAEVLKRGGAVVFPTDTLYALGVDAFNAGAVDGLFFLKKRPAEKPVPLFIKDIDAARALASLNEKQEKLMRELWPGPFTFVVKSSDAVNEKLSAGTQTIGLRIPDNEFCRLVLSNLNRPITGTSANVSGMEPPKSADGIVRQFQEHSKEPDIIIDAGELPPAEPSAVIDLTGPEPKILRLNKTIEAKLNQAL